jgi:ribosome-binding protein aMBF1 (putative translation factor)
MTGAPPGARLPRKNRTSQGTREAVENAAFQMGLVIAIERNRQGWNQSSLATRIGADQNDISAIERGLSRGLTNAQISKLFKELEMDASFKLQREFLKWWQSV